MFSPIFFHQFFSVWAVEKENKLLTCSKLVFFLSLPVEKEIHNKYSLKKIRRFEIRDWWKHLMNLLGVWVIESLYFEVSKLVWTLYTLVMTILGLKSSFFCMIWVFFPMMGRLVLERMYDPLAVQKRKKDWKW